MSNQITLPYLRCTVRQTITPFGMKEIDLLNPYENGVKDKFIVKVDLLLTLRDLWGDNIMGHRTQLYKILSGTLEDSEAYGELLASFYKRFAAFANYCDGQYFFGDNTQPILMRIVNPALDVVQKYEQDLINRYQGGGSKYLVTTHGYAYFSFSYQPDLEGLDAEVILCR